MTDRKNPPVSTRRGDDGTTTLFGSGRMSKSDGRIIVLGDVDEASSFIGLARAEAEGDTAELLIGLQRLLYRVMGDVAMPEEKNVVSENDVEYLDAGLEEWRDRTEIPKEFVIPGESRLGALLDVARSVTRRRAPLRSKGYKPSLGPPLRRRPQRRRKKLPLKRIERSPAETLRRRVSGQGYDVALPEGPRRRYKWRPSLGCSYHRVGGWISSRSRTLSSSTRR
jgi:cob(I)alamin adenosyltransferase